MLSGSSSNAWEQSSSAASGYGKLSSSENIIKVATFYTVLYTSEVFFTFFILRWQKALLLYAAALSG